MPEIIAPKAIIELTQEGKVLRCAGEWTVSGIKQSPLSIARIVSGTSTSAVLDGKEVLEMDTVGAYYLQRIIEAFKKANKKLTIEGLDERHQSILDLVGAKLPEIRETPPVKKPSSLALLGIWSILKLTNLMHFLSFTGEVVLLSWRSFLRSGQFILQNCLRIIQETGCESLPIVGLMSFLVGLVLAYQLGTQLKIYGANIYVVDVTGIAIVREFAPLMTAIIMAGRTSTSFAALIGTMKVNDEIDALITMGLSPVEKLVLPRILGLLIALPLLTIWSSLFGLLGSMIMAGSNLDIPYIAFINRLRFSVDVSHYILGLIKTPFFALIIVGVGCFQGFQASSSADSVGQKTTAAAVQSIFLIIIADAFFSIVFNWAGL